VDANASQGLDAALNCLRHAVAARGVPIHLYIHNANIYRSPQLARIAASLGTPAGAPGEGEKHGHNGD
jgi:hypothetical protein